MDLGPYHNERSKIDDPGKNHITISNYTILLFFLSCTIIMLALSNRPLWEAAQPMRPIRIGQIQRRIRKPTSSGARGLTGYLRKRQIAKLASIVPLIKTGSGAIGSEGMAITF
jgi:uncharacterized iron-regulated membrane protein